MSAFFDVDNTCSRATIGLKNSHIVDKSVFSEPDLDPMPRFVNQQKFFLRLGNRVQELRKRHGYSQEDMISYGFSARHWQQIEAGRPITVSTMLRICAVFATPVEQLVRELDKGIYEE
jgi:DNA-binding XRE family transcriptional regulator